VKLFRGLRPLQRAAALRDALAGVVMAAMDIPQVLGYSKIAGMPVVTGLYSLFLPLVAFAAFGSSRSGKSAKASDSGDDRIAVHGVFDIIARNEDVAIDVGQRNIRHDEAVAILMKDETAFNFVAGGGLMLGNFLWRIGRGALVISGRSGRLGRLAEQKAAARKFLNQTAFL